MLNHSAMTIQPDLIALSRAASPATKGNADGEQAYMIGLACGRLGIAGQ